jgi:hypothetical protein
LRGEINGAKTRESIIVLDRFLEKVAKQKNVPPGLDKTRAATSKAMARIMASQALELKGIDLYFPVPDHKAKWKGNEDLLVAYAPVSDESAKKRIVGYSVKTGEKMDLDPATPPSIPVLIVAAEEHESHEAAKMPVVTRDVIPAPDELKSPPGQLLPDEIQKIPTELHPGNSTLYGYYTMVKDDKEPWTRGSAEIYIIFVQYCGGNSRKRSNVYFVDKERKYYYTRPYTPFTFSSSCSDQTYVAVWESDGGSSRWMTVAIHGQIAGGGSYSVNLGYPYYSGDDFIEQTWFYKSWIPYNSVYSLPNMGYYADVRMYKVH